MSDDDPAYSKVEQPGDYKCLVTLAHYKLPDNAAVMLCQRDQYDSLENNRNRSNLGKYGKY